MVVTVDRNNPAYKHGHAGKSGFSPTYHSWATMIQRCTNKSRKSWPDYGGRGIMLCERWLKFESFLADMGERPDGTTLDRVDNNGNYEPTNCQWATTIEQSKNRRTVVVVEIAGRTAPLNVWCTELNVSINTVRDRVKFHKMDYVEALTLPRQSKPFKKVMG